MSDFKEMNNLQEEAKAQDTLPARLTELANISDELAEIVASNVSAPPELLKELASYDNNTVKKVVVSNPNTPTEILFKLAEYYPQEFSENPILDILFLENPNLIREFPKQTLVALLQQLNIPEFILKSLVNHSVSDIPELARLHVNYAGEMSQGWHEAAQSEIEKINSYSDFVVENDFNLLSSLISIIPAYFWNNNCIRMRIAGSLKTSPLILKKLAEDSDREVRTWVADNKKTPLKILQQLAFDPDYYVRLHVVDNPNITVEIIKKLASDRYWDIRSSVASLSNTPIGILKILSNDVSHYVRVCS